MTLGTDVPLVVEFLNRVGQASQASMRIRGRYTYISERRVDPPTHLCNPPFHDIAKLLVVDVVVLAADRSLGTLLQLILTMTEPVNTVP